MRHHLLAWTAILLSLQCGIALADSKPGMSDFNDGLTALQQRKWADAEKAMGKAIDADDENASYHLGRGMAAMLNQDWQTADAELSRAQRLDPSCGAGEFGQRSQSFRALMKIDRRQTSIPQSDIDFQTGRMTQQIDAFVAKEQQGNPDLVQAQRDRINANFAAGKYDAVMPDLQQLLAQHPNDRDLMQMAAVCLRAKGDYTSARAGLTRILTAKGDFGPAYAERAIDEANLGNAKRAQSDLNLANQFDPSAASAAKPLVEEAIKKVGDLPDPQAAWEALRQAAFAGKSIDDMVPMALTLVRAMNAKRLRWDEIYQDQLFALENAVKAHPQDVNAMLALGKFIYSEADAFGERRGPGGHFQTFRFTEPGTYDAEVRAADQVFDHVLQVDPNNTEAMTCKAAVRLENNAWDDGVQWVNKALAAGPATPELMELLSRVLDESGDLKSAQAANLRTPKSWFEWGINVTWVFTRSPTQGELAEADELDQRANQLWAQAESALAAAMKAKAGTADGEFLAALYAHRQGDDANALVHYQNAAKMDPSRRNRTALATAYRRAGQIDDAVAETEAFTLTRQTTAVTRLAKAWQELERTAFKSAAPPLQAAQQIDPADSRVPAYLAALTTAQKNDQEAINWYQMALAMEEAHAQLAGRSLLNQSAFPLRADDAAFSLLLNLRCAARYKDLKQPDKELEALKRNLAIEPKLLPAALHVASDHVIMPDILDPRATSARPTVYYLGWSHVYAGYALLSAGKTEDAYKQFMNVKNWSKEPACFESRQLAYAAALRLALAKGNPSQKKKWLAAAHREEPLTDDEVQQVDQAMSTEKYNNSKNWTAQQYADFDAKRMELYDMRQKPNTPGGYDFRNNPNYQGTDDIGPDDVHVDVPNNANAVLRRGATEGGQPHANPNAAE